MSDLIERLGKLIELDPKVFALLASSVHLRRQFYDTVSRARDELSRLQSLSDQNRLTGGWRDIESAPKDGTLILLYGDTPDGPRVTTGNWLAPEHGDYLGDCGGVCRCPEYDDPPEPFWWDTDGGFTDEWPPLGWQPFPSPPLPLPGGEEKR